MMFIDPHTHMISRTTDDYEAMARAGVVAVIEPAFWLGQPRTYRRHLHRLPLDHRRLGALPRRPVRHPPLLHDRPQLQGGQQRGAGRGGDGDAAALRAQGGRRRDRRDRLRRADPRSRTSTSALQLELAKELELPVMIHTPHRDKKRGTTPLHGRGRGARARRRPRSSSTTTTRRPCRRCSTAASGPRSRSIRSTKMGNERMVEIVRQYGPERIIVDSACDWGVSDSLAVPKTAKLMLERGIPEAHIAR